MINEEKQYIEVLNSDLILEGESIYLSNCFIKLLNLSGLEIVGEVVVKNCIIENMIIHSCWFYGGFYFINNIVISDVDYQMGGHNKKEIIINGNVFEGVLNFFDCHFEEKVTLMNNNFLKGCDILYNENKGFDNIFASGLLIEKNVGVQSVTHMEEKENA